MKYRLPFPSQVLLPCPSNHCSQSEYWRISLYSRAGRLTNRHPPDVKSVVQTIADLPIRNGSTKQQYLGQGTWRAPWEGKTRMLCLSASRLLRMFCLKRGTWWSQQEGLARPPALGSFVAHSWRACACVLRANRMQGSWGGDRNGDIALEGNAEGRVNPSASPGFVSRWPRGVKVSLPQSVHRPQGLCWHLSMPSALMVRE